MHNSFDLFTRVRYNNIQMKTVRSLFEAERELSGTQIAHHFSVGEATIRRWKALGMPARACNARLFRYRLSEVEAWLDARASKKTVREVTVSSKRRKTLKNAPTGKEN
jgi:hypothetical protein